MTRVDSPREVAVPAADAGVSVALVHSEAEARDAVRALAAVWARDDGKEPLPPELAWVFAHSGNYVSVARIDGQVIGAAIGFRGSDDEGPLLHSHIAGVVPNRQGSSVGYALKQHQRSWALAEGLDRITWTFDPLVARNAYFNVVKLGARLTSYYVDFYGPMDDGINTGDETDRCLATWRLTDPAAVSAAAGEFAPADAAVFRAAGAAEVLRSDIRLLRVPDDVVALRRIRPELAREWRLALREALTAAFADGLEVVGVSRDSTYVLARPSS
jgi:predicted GNAT superfamily acetyltransferase